MHGVRFWAIISFRKAVLDPPYCTIQRFAAIAEHALAVRIASASDAEAEPPLPAADIGAGAGADADAMQVQSKEGWPGNARAAVLLEVLRVAFKLLDALPLATKTTPTTTTTSSTAMPSDATTGVGGQGESEDAATQLVTVARAVFIRATGVSPEAFALRDAAGKRTAHPLQLLSSLPCRAVWTSV